MIMKGHEHRVLGSRTIARWTSALAIALVFAAPLAAETIDRVLAVVAGQLIMESDVVGMRELGFVSPDPGANPDASVLSKLIDRELMLAEVDRYAPPEPDSALVDRQVAAVRARFPSQQAYDAVLSRAGLTQANVREIVRQNLRLEAYLDERFVTQNGDRQGRQAMIDEWVADLRRRSPAMDLSTRP